MASRAASGRARASSRSTAIATRSVGWSSAITAAARHCGSTALPSAGSSARSPRPPRRSHPRPARSSPSSPPTLPCSPTSARASPSAPRSTSRCGGVGHDGSGDLFLAFSTAHRIPPHAERPIPIDFLAGNRMDPLIEAAADCIEESILNALCAAETMTGFRGRTVPGLPLEGVRAILKDNPTR